LDTAKGTTQLSLGGRGKSQGRGCLCCEGAGEGEAAREGEEKGGEIKGGGGGVAEGCSLQLIAHEGGLNSPRAGGG